MEKITDDNLIETLAKDSGCTVDEIERQIDDLDVISG